LLYSPEELCYLVDKKDILEILFLISPVEHFEAASKYAQDNYLPIKRESCQVFTRCYPRNISL